MPKQLVVLAGPDEGRVFNLDGDVFMLGRSRATESQLIDPHVSRVHCQINLDESEVTISDFDSPSGTFVNGKRITQQPLHAGDLIRVGNTRLQYVADSADTQATSATTVVARPIAKPVNAVPDWPRKLTGEMFTHYKVESLLGKGKAGYVFHARDTRRNLEVALKVLKPEYSASDANVQRFVEAMKTVLPLRHTNLMRVFGAGKTGQHCWVATEYIVGESLSAVIGRITPDVKLDWRNVLKMMLYLARALDYAHKKDLIHQCVAPQNILRTKDIAEIKLTDLMLASALEQDPTVPGGDNEPSDALAYMPPERTDGHDQVVDRSTDIYSLGATVYALLTGKPPYEAKTVDEMVDKIRLECPEPIREFYADVPAAFEKLVQRCMAKRRVDRPQSAVQLISALDKILTENP